MMLQNLKREKLLTLSNIGVMAFTFLTLGTFIALIALTQTGIRALEKQAQVSLFFKDEFPESDILALKTELENDERISQVSYISKQDALAIFVEENKDDPILLEAASAEILPASLEIRTKDLADLTVMSEELITLDGVEEVVYRQDVIERFKYWSGIAYTIGFLLTVVLMLISFAVVLITLRITINSKGKELEILKLVGASDAYVKKPLIQQGLFFGVSSSLIASLVLLLIAIILQIIGLANYVEFSFFPEFAIHFLAFILGVCLILMILGALLGYFGSQTAIKKYLKY